MFAHFNILAFAASRVTRLDVGLNKPVTGKGAAIEYSRLRPNSRLYAFEGIQAVR